VDENKFVKPLLLTVTCLFFISFAISTPTTASYYPGSSDTSSTPEPISPTPTPESGDQRFDLIETRMDALEKFVEVVSLSFNSAIARMESNINLMLGIIAVASVILAILGFGVMRLWIARLVENQVRQTASEEVERVAEAEAKRIRDEWDPKMAEIYEEYRRAIPRK